MARTSWERSWAGTERGGEPKGDLWGKRAEVGLLVGGFGQREQ